MIRHAPGGSLSQGGEPLTATVAKLRVHTGTRTSPSWQDDAPRTRAPCALACPLGIDIPEATACIARGDPAGALRRVLHATPFPSCCAFLCHHPCQSACVRGAGVRPVAIRHLLRHAIDQAGPDTMARTAGPATGRRVAVVGGGPAGLAAAHELAMAGHQVTVLDRAAQPGGATAVVVPGFRLPQEHLHRDLERVFSAGVTLKAGFQLGRDFTLNDLAAEGFDAVLLAIGLGRPRPTHVAGDELDDVLDAKILLARAAATPPPAFTGDFVSIGGTGTAFDAARTALRLGAASATVVFPMPLSDLPLPEDDLRSAEQEGVRTLFLAEPVRILRRGRHVVGVRVRKVMPLPNAVDAQPIPIPDTEIDIPARQVCVARTRRERAPNRELASLDADEHGQLILDPVTHMTSCPGIFGAGDLAGGPRRIAETLADGRRAGQAIDAWLRGQGGSPRAPERPVIAHVAAPADPLEPEGVTWDGVETPSNLDPTARCRRASEEARRCLDCPCRQGCTH